MGHTISVEVIPRKRWTLTDCVGIFDPAKNHIAILRQPKASQTAHCFWHEATHAMLYFMGHKLYSNENFVDQIGGLLAQIMESKQ